MAKRFNTLNTLKQYVNDPVQAAIIDHPASEKNIMGAKDTGKTWLVNLFEIYSLENDPKANAVAVKKYKLNASQRLGDEFHKIINQLRNDDFVFPYKYRKASNLFYRDKNRKQSLDNQRLEFASFEDYNSIAGITFPNGGYCTSLHIEEPDLFRDSLAKVYTKRQWKDQMAVLKDSIERATRTYRKTNPYTPPAPMTTFITLNLWNKYFPLTQRMLRYIPEERWINFIFDLSSINVTLKELTENPDLLDKHWAHLRNSLHKNYVISHYIEYDTEKATYLNPAPKSPYDEPTDTLVVRTTKYANPSIRLEKVDCDKVDREVYSAILEDNKTQLARLLGTLNSYARSDYPLAYALDDYRKIIIPHQYTSAHHLYSMSFAYDMDLSSRLVCSSLSHMLISLSTDQTTTHTAHKITIHPQITIISPTKKARSNQPFLQHQFLLSILQNIYNTHTLLTTSNTRLSFLTYVYFYIDDNTSSYTYLATDTLHRIYLACKQPNTDPLLLTKYNIDPTKIKKILDIYPKIIIDSCSSYKVMPWFRIVHRQEQATFALNNNLIKINKSNLELLETLITIPKLDDTKDKVGQRIEKGHFVKAMDTVNAFEYSLLSIFLEIPTYHKQNIIYEQNRKALETLFPKGKECYTINNNYEMIVTKEKNV